MIARVAVLGPQLLSRTSASSCPRSSVIYALRRPPSPAGRSWMLAPVDLHAQLVASASRGQPKERKWHHRGTGRCLAACTCLTSSTRRASAEVCGGIGLFAIAWLSKMWTYEPPRWHVSLSVVPVCQHACCVPLQSEWRNFGSVRALLAVSIACVSRGSLVPHRNRELVLHLREKLGSACNSACVRGGGQSKPAQCGRDTSSTELLVDTGAEETELLA